MAVFPSRPIIASIEAEQETAPKETDNATRPTRMGRSVSSARGSPKTAVVAAAVTPGRGAPVARPPSWPLLSDEGWVVGESTSGEARRRSRTGPPVTKDARRETGHAMVMPGAGAPTGDEHDHACAKRLRQVRAGRLAVSWRCRLHRRRAPVSAGRLQRTRRRRRPPPLPDGSVVMKCRRKATRSEAMLRSGSMITKRGWQPSAAPPEGRLARARRLPCRPPPARIPASARTFRPRRTE